MQPCPCARLPFEWGRGDRLLVLEKLQPILAGRDEKPVTGDAVQADTRSTYAFETDADRASQADAGPADKACSANSAE